MLRVIKSMKELDFSALMEVYAEGNLENGAEFWPDEPEGQQLLKAEQAFYQYLRECFFAVEGAMYCIWEENGRYVSALRLEPYQDGLLLEALETAPEKRRRGYARMLIRAVLAGLSNQRIYSHVGKWNTASIKTHEACGFRKILDHAVYADGSVMTNSSTYLVNTAPPATTT